MHVLTVLCAGGWMSANLSEGWRRLGCEVTEFFYGTHMGRAWDAAGAIERARVNAELLGRARALRRAGRLDLIFAVIYDDMLDERTARALRQLDVPLVNYHVDLVGQWYRVLRTGRYFDVVACAQREHWRGLQRAGIRPVHLPMAANPDRAEPAPPAAGDAFAGVLYLGSPWAYRCEVLAQLAASGVPLRVLGRNWDRTRPDPANSQPWRKTVHDARHYLVPRLRDERIADLGEVAGRRLGVRRRAGARGGALVTLPVLGGPYDDGALPALVRGAAVNLGFSHFRGRAGSRGERRQMRLRDFEIPMAGGFYLAQRCPELESAYDLGAEVAAWDDADELPALARYYLERPDLRAAMARRAQARCERDHTWARRFSDLLAHLGVPAPAAAEPPPMQPAEILVPS